MRRTVPPSAEIEAQIDRLLAVGVGENPRESLSELARLGARLIIQRAVEDEFDAWLGLLRTEPLKGLVIGAFVRGLSMRDVESLCAQAGLGKLSKSTASRDLRGTQRPL